MKVRIGFGTTDSDGNALDYTVCGELEKEENRYRITYDEDLSGEGDVAHSVLSVSKNSIRLLRFGAVACDFLYSDGMVNHTFYETAYGRFAVTVTTTGFFCEVGETKDTKPLIDAKVDYDMAFNGDEPSSLQIRFTVVPEEPDAGSV